jgi:hypothetical protein
MLGSESDVDSEDQQYEASHIFSDGICNDLDGTNFLIDEYSIKFVPNQKNLILNWKSIGRKNVYTNKLLVGF